jgi:hypothetical protein
VGYPMTWGRVKARNRVIWSPLHYEGTCAESVARLTGVDVETCAVVLAAFFRGSV